MNRLQIQWGGKTVLENSIDIKPITKQPSYHLCHVGKNWAKHDHDGKVSDPTREGEEIGDVPASERI